MMDDARKIELLEWQLKQQARVITKQRQTIEFCRKDFNRGSRWHDKCIQVMNDLFRTTRELEAVKAELDKLKNEYKS
jgi:multidrug resistance efflux pump